MLKVQSFVPKVQHYVFNPKIVSDIDPSKLKPQINQVLKQKQKPKVSELDILAFRKYDQVRSLDMHITQKELDTLFKFEGDEFFDKSLEFLCKKLGISENLRPQVISAPQAPEVGMAYSYISNLVIKNPNTLQKGKHEVFANIRHELQHLLQNISIYRHEELGPKAVVAYAEKFGKLQAENVDNIVKNHSLEQLDQLGLDDATATFYKELKKLIQKNDIQSYDDSLKSFSDVVKEAYMPQLENYRNLVLQDRGIIQKGTKAASRAEKFFSEFIGDGYHNADGSIHWGKYAIQASEEEAFSAQSAMAMKLQGNNTCYIKEYKNAMEILDDARKKDPTNQYFEDLTETANDMKKTDFKDLVKYIYD